MAYDDSYYFGQCKIIVTVEDNADDGKSVTVSNGSRNWSGTLTNKKCSIMVPCRDEYTVTLVGASGAEDSTTITCGYGDCFSVELGTPSEAKTFADIKKILKAHKENQYLEVGDTITNRLTDGTQLDYEIAAINLYTNDYAHNVIMKPKWLLPNKMAMTKSGWSTCDMRTYLNGTFYSMLSDDAKSAVSEITRKTILSGSVLTETTTQDKIFIPDLVETSNTRPNQYYSPADSRQFPVFTSPSKRVMTLGQSGAADGWWLSTIYNGTGNGMSYINASGTHSNVTSNTSTYALCPCFMIGVQ